MIMKCLRAWKLNGRNRNKIWSDKEQILQNKDIEKSSLVLICKHKESS